MKRIDDIMAPNEEIVKEFKPDFVKLYLTTGITKIGILTLLLALVIVSVTSLTKLVLLVPVILILLGLVPSFIRYYFTSYIITTHKVILESGIIGRDYDVVKLSKIFDANIDVTVVDTIFGTGSIKLSTSNESEPIIIRDIKHPKKILNLIEF